MDNKDDSQKTPPPPLSERDTYLADTAHKIVAEIFNLVDSERKTQGDIFYKELTLTIITSTVATLVYRSLTSPSEYAQMKKAIENSIASAFVGGHTGFGETSEENIDFVCRVLNVGEPINKLPA